MTFPSSSSEIEGDFLAHPYNVIYDDCVYFITDSKDNCIKTFDSNGRFINKIGQPGTGPGELINPVNMAMDTIRNRIYCEDRGNHRLSFFTTDGRFIRNIKILSGRIGNMIFFNNQIYLLSADPIKNSLITVYDTTGTIVRYAGNFFDPGFNALGHRYSQLLYSRADMAAYNDSLYVAFRFLPIIQVYDKAGNLARTIRIKNKQIADIYSHNTDIENVRSGKMERWVMGMKISDNKIYCYSPGLLKCMLVLDMLGKLEDCINIDFSDGLAEEYGYPGFFVELNGDEFIFVDFRNACIHIFK
jgi:hypothetical protein